MKKRSRFKLSTSHLILLSFALAILLGSVLLVLPISSHSGESVSYIDALFTATTATCVTGLVTLPTISSWSIFGQIVILILIQLGGLGIITVISAIMLSLHRKMKLGDRILLQDAFNLNTLSGIGEFVKKVVIGTLIIEGLGALLYMLVFIPEFGAKGIWISIFTSVSAFCNAGIDIISTNSLCDYATNPLINTVTSALIILGGIGYIVWWDIARVTKDIRKRGLKCFSSLTLHSKIAIFATLCLILLGGVLILLLEYNNPLTIGELSFFDKLQVSFFQSITTRTAGFASIPQESLTDASAIVCILLMFIGGSPVGTAGGIKTVTIFILVATAISVIKNRNDTVLFKRTIQKQAVLKAIAVTTVSLATAIVSTILLSVTSDASFMDVLYEAVSATATVGLSRNLTPFLNIWGKIIIIITMYLGRIGPISLAIAFNIRKENPNIIKNPTEIISVG